MPIILHSAKIGNRKITFSYHSLEKKPVSASEMCHFTRIPGKKGQKTNGSRLFSRGVLPARARRPSAQHPQY